MMDENISKYKYWKKDYYTAHQLDALTWTQDPTYTNCWSADHAYGVPVEVKENGTGYVLKETLYLCNATASTFTYDSANRKIYVHTSGGNTPQGNYTVYSYVTYLQDNADGTSIPELYGAKSTITPTCVDINNLTYRFNRRASYALVGVVADDVPLLETSDYIVDLDGSGSIGTASTFRIYGSPKLTASTTYWFVLESDLAVDGSNYIAYASNDNYGSVGGATYAIDAGGSWSIIAPSPIFQIFGKADLTSEGTESPVVEYVDWSHWGTNVLAFNVAGNTRIAVQFTTPSGNDFYLTKIVLYPTTVGSPSNKIRISILDQAPIGTGTQEHVFGSKSQWTPVSSSSYNWTLRAAPSKVTCSAIGIKNLDGTPMTNVADIISDVYVNILGGTASSLDTSSFTALKSEKTEILSVFIDRDLTFGNFLTKLESGQLFKFIPSMDGKYTVRYYDSGEPAGTPHYTDEDFIDFQSQRLWANVFNTIKVKYAEDATKQEFMCQEVSSEIADHVYENRETLTVETYLNSQVDALALCLLYLGMYQTPQLQITFTVGGGNGWALVPTDKVKITRATADYTSGNLDGVLFRVFDINKNITNGTTKITAILDSMTY